MLAELLLAVNQRMLRHNIERVPDIKRQLLILRRMVNLVLAHKLQAVVRRVLLEHPHLALRQRNP